MVAALAAAVVRHENAVKLSQTAWLNPAGSAELFAIERNAVRAARQVAELASALGLSPIARSIQGLRCRLLNPDRPFPDNPHLRVFELIGSSGKRRRASWSKSDA